MPSFRLLSRPRRRRAAAAVVLAVGVMAGTDAWAQLRATDYQSNATFRTGVMSFTKSDGDASIPGSAGLITNLEFALYPQKDKAILLGYRDAQDAATKRIAYQAAYLGYRAFPSTLGIPVNGITDNASITYDFLFRPYLDFQLALGHYVYSYGAGGAADFSSDILGLLLGGGTQIRISERFAADVNVLMEVDQARGGGPESLQFSANNMWILLGVAYVL